MPANFESNLGTARGLVAPWILLLLAEAPGHGWELMARLKRLGFEWSGPGPIYRELHSLEAAHLVTSAWSLPKSGPVPRVYQLTPAGRRALEQSGARMAALDGVVAEYLARFRTVTAEARASASPAPSQPEPQAEPPARRGQRRR